MAFHIYVVSGKFLLPGGSRKTVSLPPTKVIAESRRQASADLVPLLNQTFRKELQRESRAMVGEHTFGKDFALLQLKWEDYKAVTPRDKALEHLMHNATAEP